MSSSSDSEDSDIESIFSHVSANSSVTASSDSEHSDDSGGLDDFDDAGSENSEDSEGSYESDDPDDFDGFMPAAPSNSPESTNSQISVQDDPPLRWPRNPRIFDHHLSNVFYYHSFCRANPLYWRSYQPSPADDFFPNGYFSGTSTWIGRYDVPNVMPTWYFDTETCDQYLHRLYASIGISPFSWQAHWLVASYCHRQEIRLDSNHDTMGISFPHNLDQQELERYWSLYHLEFAQWRMKNHIMIALQQGLWNWYKW